MSVSVSVFLFLSLSLSLAVARAAHGSLVVYAVVSLVTAFWYSIIMRDRLDQVTPTPHTTLLCC